MASLLDLIAQYGNGPNNPYATQQPQAVAPAADSTPAVPVSTLIDLLGRSSNNPYANMGAAVTAAPPATGLIGPMGFGGGGALQTADVSGAPQFPPSIVAAQKAADARGEAEYWAARTPQDRAATAAAIGYTPQPQTNDLQIGSAAGAPDVTVDSQGNASDAWQPNSKGGGLIGALQQGASDPSAAKSLLSTFADQAKSVGEKLTNLSPNASQALIASGLTMLAGNDGTRNLGQLVGLGGISGLNSYNANREQQAQMALAAQKLQQTAQQQGFDNALAARKQMWEEGKPVSVGLDQSLINPRTGQAIVQAQPGVARTAEIQGPDGNTYTVQLDRTGNIVGQPLLKSNPNVGPLGDPQQKTVNDAQTAAASARQTYQNTAYLANQLSTAPDFASGFGASVNDTLTKLTGNKDAGQQLRGQLSQFANSSILSELPPGSASDKDIQLVRNGVPSDTASKETWQSYLTAVGRVQQVAALYQNAKSDYVTANRGDLGPLKRDATINGIQYPAGTTFAQALTGQAPQQQQSSAGGAVPYSAALAEARRRGLIK